MIIRGLDGNGDWRFGKGKNDYLSFNQAIMQNIATRLRSFLGDCFFAPEAGLDWFNLLGSKNQLALELAVRSVILNTTGVTSIVNLSINLEESTRLISMTYTITTVFTDNSGTVPIVSNSSFLLTEAGDVLITQDGDAIGAG
jgi:hypothetical protein